ncbi:sec1 family domain-containing protein [Ditylenchus destructor]|uniref:Vacuolar protein sorting-associated protein 45 n=1 Tax=Ditylenchus destructor TaxID=166010 RepID=A0AAD4MUX3_9BILA|nr:sec1 family domain-containing protein [Ditylenchus destructor]
MDLMLATQHYVNEMIRLAGPGMKVILMDKETTSMISCAFAQSEMMQKEVYLFERIDSGAIREPIKFLKCVVYVRPTPENIQLLSEELRTPKYAQYYIYFSNIISKADIKILAEADEQETVREVREFYADVISLVPHVCSLGIPNCYETPFNMSASIFRRTLQGLIAILLAIKKRPVIRYQTSSRDSQRLADELSKVFVREETLFDGCKPDTVMVILDRSEDPVSPLLNQWTYEAMVHELIGINNNRVIMENVPADGQKNIVLSPQHDEFYTKNMYLNFGDIGQNIKALMNDYQKKAQTHQQLESINDMKRFVEQYPQFKKISGTVTKHVQLVGELSRIVTTENLLEISELEQNIVNTGEHGQCLETLKRLLQHPKTSELNALRLVMLYALRFENNANNSLNSVVDLLKQKNMPQRHINNVRLLLDYAGAKRRHHDVFGNRSAMEMTKRFIKGLKGVENIYTQHEPYITQLIDQVSRGRLPDSLFASSDASQINTRFENVIIFIIGGCTYEESAFVNSLNAKRSQSGSSGQLRVLLASTYVHNTRSFIQQLAHLGDTSHLSSAAATSSFR